MTAKSLMVVGTASSVGKSLLVTAFCRMFKRHGYSVAPFKSQNMSLNSFVTPEGHEMGRAQVSQAEAAGLTPSALMNPILLKPTTNSKSQVIVNGRVHGNMSAVEYYEYKDNLRPAVSAAYDTLAAQYDIIVLEGAGSPAEINLMDGDFVNMGMAAMADAPVLLAGDIDRGGVFASLYGTVKLLPPADQARIKGLIVNKFRGDVKILEPGLRQIEELLLMPVLGVVPYGKFAIDEEDSLTERLAAKGTEAGVKIAVLRLPRLSNFTDFAVFDTLDDVSLTFVDSPAQLDAADLIIIPGSKNTVEDMRHLEDSGLADRLKSLAAKGKTIAGICGGFQILGRMIHDPFGVESDLGGIAGLGLLDVETSFASDKHTTQTRLTLTADPGLLQGTAGLSLAGYEIHMGETKAGPDALPLAEGDNGPDGAINKAGNVFGSYLHGFFDNLEFTRRLLNNIRRSKGLAESDDAGNRAGTFQQFKEREYDRLADMVEAAIPFERLLAIAGLERKN
ncbi:cobyric acid synthase [Deltaproteobacteria bacterium OttesenSCG-928-K17]|nr:cobyric acid synthase [Deltaproteobacteria bacterium OttesenSCG-928-K17]